MPENKITDSIFFFKENHDAGIFAEGYHTAQILTRPMFTKTVYLTMSASDVQIFDMQAKIVTLKVLTGYKHEYFFFKIT